MKKGSVFIVLLICAASICCVSKKEVNNTAKTEMKDIEGHYINNEDDTVIYLIITKDDNKYEYIITTPHRHQKGTIKYSDDPSSFVLERLKWSSWEIDGTPQKLPEEVVVFIDENGGLKIQNIGGNSTSHYTIFNDIDKAWITLEKDIIFVTLPNGAVVDKRIPKDLVDSMFKRFEAIENGDIAAFRSTLGEMQDGVDYNYQVYLLCMFFGDFFDIEPDAFHEALADGGEEYTEIAHTLLTAKHPLQSRNTGLSIKKMEFMDTGGLRVTATNNKNEEIIYDFPYY